MDKIEAVFKVELADNGFIVEAGVSSPPKIQSMGEYAAVVPQDKTHILVVPDKNVGELYEALHQWVVDTEAARVKQKPETTEISERVCTGTPECSCSVCLQAILDGDKDDGTKKH